MLEHLVAAMAGLAEVDPDGLTDAELDDAMVALRRCESMLQAHTARLTGAWDARRCWQASGACSGAAWLTATCRVPRQQAGREIRLARAARELPVAAGAWAAGDIGAAHVHRLTRAANHRTSAALADDEKQLVDAAETLWFAEFDRVVAHWADAADPDGSDEAAERRRERRRVDLSESIDGVWFGDLVLDPISGAIVAGELRRIETELLEADRAEAKVRLGTDEPAVTERARTPAQRRADALVEMATRSRTAPAGGRRPAPLFTVLVGYETFAGRICQLDTNSPAAPADLRPWLDRFTVERVVFDAPGHVVEVSRQRCYTGLLRRAVEVRDRECYHPLCDRPAERSQVDHITPAGQNGPTTQANGRLACGYHNRLRSQPQLEPP